jgi:hypothetical protein
VNIGTTLITSLFKFSLGFTNGKISSPPSVKKDTVSARRNGNLKLAKEKTTPKRNETGYRYKFHDICPHNENVENKYELF